MNKVKAHISDANTGIKQVDPNEDNPSLNSVLASLNLALEEIRVYENKKNMLIEELKEI